jgi:hypothetical protein
MDPIGRSRIRFILTGLFILIIGGYSLYALRNYLEGPRLTINFPTDGYSTTSPAIRVQGVVLRTNFISLNDRPIYIDEQGNFSEVLLLDPGYTIIKLFIRDRFDRSVTRTLYVRRDAINLNP